MAGSFTFVSKPGKKIALERVSHPCPKCKHYASVQLIRSEKQLIVFNVILSSVMRVRYECSKCNWRNEALPYHQLEFNNTIHEGRLITYFNESSKVSSLSNFAH
ncbi:uncharacterized protein EV154DRAFT_507111 [Mucor mucedo]|uniref:Uncharacterized protein n=1 Tax=Mucor saturninus TaxID=64648 RepID=A0A8H7VB46_9FUNG|nr:uncharacterized protein EV154DRAFT_507111 [Mucor mucedo]KAG2207924.1 hypothetical protein INT47_010908 [Mucor saturninus]KAI7891748.1 hypothetical protein EV154DRAFT_507111 [Mucor mucedo]